MGLLNFVTFVALILLAINSGDNLVGGHNHCSAQSRKHRHGGGHNRGERYHTTTKLPKIGTQVSSVQTCTAKRNTVPIVHSSPEKSRTKITASTTSIAHNPSSASKYPPLEYSLLKSYSAGSFFDQFNFYTGEDPTHGFVEYPLIESFY